jgi:CRP-like cAMP-binding protein
MKATPSDIAAGTSRLLANGWLSRTPSDFQTALLAGIVWRNLEPAEPIMFGGDVEGGLFGIARGSCHFLAAEGLPDLPAIHIGRSGTWMGMAPVVKATARMATAVVRSPALIAHLPQSAFNAMIAERPERWPIFSLILVEVTAKSFQAVADLMIPDSRRRLIAVLLLVAPLYRWLSSAPPRTQS